MAKIERSALNCPKCREPVGQETKLDRSGEGQQASIVWDCDSCGERVCRPLGAVSVADAKAATQPMKPSAVSQPDAPAIVDPHQELVPTVEEISRDIRKATRKSLTSFEAAIRFGLFDRDVQGAELSFRLFTEAKMAVTAGNISICSSSMRAIMYHASCFVCSVRRAEKLLRALYTDRNLFPGPIAKVIQLEWKKKHSFLWSFVAPRDAIEHMDSKMRGKTSFIGFNLINDEFVVLDDVSVPINQAAIDKLCAVRDTIAEAITSEWGPDCLV